MENNPAEKFDDKGGAYWNDLYDANALGWDLGQVSPPIKEYIDQLADKSLRILIPGCGNTHEAAYLLEEGFTNVTVIDIAPTLVARLKSRFADNPNIHIILGDFFVHHGTYDLILEQTFFCALDPGMRKKHVAKMNELLADNGKLVGLLFDKEFERQGPPFGGSKAEYVSLFGPSFHFQVFEACRNSFIKRQGSELFMILQKKG